MNREEFIISAAVVLFLAFLLGWLSRWFLQRLNMVSEKDLKDLNKISAALLEAEKGNEKARNRELELNKKISQLEAELEAAMDGLRAARLETEELKSSLVEKKRLSQNFLCKIIANGLKRSHPRLRTPPNFLHRLKLLFSKKEPCFLDNPLNIRLLRRPLSCAQLLSQPS